MSRNILKKRFSLKDQLFNKAKVEYLADLFVKSDRTFMKKEFVEEVMKKLLKLELKERIVWIAEVLEEHLPKRFEVASKIIIKALPPPLDPKKTDDDFGDFIFAPLGEYVVRNGLKKEFLTEAFATLHALTQRFSMEDATRSFINTFPKEILAFYKKWLMDENYHVRRLVSESTRPLLPWSRRLSLHISTPTVFLDALHSDKTRYVTRSVANHLNDISKSRPEIVLELLQAWQKKGKQNKEELLWMTKHALRTLVKRGNTDALSLLGFEGEVRAKVEQFSLKATSKKIAPGGTLSFSFTMVGMTEENLLIDYIIDFVKAKGHTKPKVFKLKKLCIKKGERVHIVKNHRLLADATTFTLHKGIHTLTLQINGKKCNSTTFSIV